MKFLKLPVLFALSLMALAGCSHPDNKALEKTEDYAAESVNEAFNELGEEASKSADETTKMQDNALHGTTKKDASLEEQALDIVE